ncbi:MATE family efflux transporter [Arcobacter arenosus]|jgi:putative MATE family efflux protein|uniref:MATE family efflux transporter n=1 Tax=Arcobacter arenosus TaxID=2576037 RepID=A0A5R8Y2D4_9BACT|nr:MATE family efflux transporter [Arcobacter arenosus]TLP39239.1 MATE family efflux transporter [Arcobacter arenosus]
MKTKSKHLLTDDIPSLLKQIAIPASTGMFFNTMYNVVDTFYAGLISTQAISALSLSFMIFFTIIGLGYGFSSAITALIGNASGKSKKFLASLYAHKGIFFMQILAVALTIIGFIISPTLFKILGASGEYLETSLSYINVILTGTIFFMTNFALNAILVSRGDTKSYRNTLIFGFFANLILNPLFIYGFWFIPAMGISGIAFATVLIQVLNNIYMLKKVLETKLIHFENLKYFYPHLKIYKDFIIQGIPSSMNMLIMAIGSIILMYFVTLYGVKAVAGYGIGFRVEQLMLLPALGLSSAVLSIISNNFGAKKYDRVQETLNTALKYGFYISTFGIIFLYIFGKLIISQFDSDLEVIRYGLDYLLVEVWIFYAYVILFICVSTLQAIKKPKMILYIALYRQIIAKYLVAYILVVWLALDYFYLWFGILVMIYSAAIFAYFYTQNLLKNVGVK